MNTQALADELSQLLATETRSLCRHLDEAKPYVTPKTYRLWQDVQDLSHVSVEHGERLSAIFERLEMSPKVVTYRTDVANYHFMAMSALLPLIIEEKRRQIAAYERAISHAGGAGGSGGDVKIVDELTALLTENRSQLEMLESAGRGLATAAR